MPAPKDSFGGKVVDKAAYFKLIGYEPHPKQWLFHRSDSRFRIPCCGRRFGKSTMAARDREPDLLVPERRAWIVGPTYDLAEKEFRVIWDDMIIGLQLGRDKRVKKAYNKRSGEMYIEFPWRTRVECRSADHPENLVGERLDFAILSEAAKHKKDTWERFIRPALADRRGGADFPTTPEGYNWYYDIWALGNHPDYPDFASWKFPSWDNPVVYPGGREDPEIKLIESTTIEPWFLQEIAAEFSAFVGKIYGEWQEQTHVRKVEYNPDWPNYIAWDWGYVNPLAAIEFQIDPWDRVHVWREHYQSYTLLNDHMDIMSRRAQPPGYKVTLMFGDAADPEATLAVAERMKVGCYALPESKSNWRQGVDLVKSFLKMRQVGEVDEYGTPREEPWLFVDHSCTNTIREFNNYRAPSSVGRVLRNPREDAQKYDDHALDALRYGLMHIFVLGCTHSLSEVYRSSDFEESNKVFEGDGDTYFSMADLETF